MRQTRTLRTPAGTRMTTTRPVEVVTPITLTNLLPESPSWSRRSRRLSRHTHAVRLCLAVITAIKERAGEDPATSKGARIAAYLPTWHQDPHRDVPDRRGE